MRRLGFILAVVVVIVAGLAIKMVLHQPPEIQRPPLPDPMPMAEEISFASGDITLAGQWFLSDGPPLGAAVIIHGSGNSRRSNGWYGTLTAELVSRGFAVLLPDKRGSEASGGDWRAASMEELSHDTAAAVAWVRENNPDLPVGIIGVSQGGWVAAILAERDGDLAFAANLSGSSVRPPEQLVLEERNTMRDEFGLPDPLARALAPLTAWNIRRNVQPELWDSLGDFYANDHWANAQVPVFIAYGELDQWDNVPVAQSVDRITALNHPLIELQVFPGVGHGFFNYETGVIDAGFLTELESFLTRALTD